MNKASIYREVGSLSYKDKLLYGSSVIFMLYAILVYVYPTIHMVHKLYMQQKVKVDIRTLMAEQSRLRLEYEMLVSYDEMGRLAMEVGFIKPEQDQIVYVMKKK